MMDDAVMTLSSEAPVEAVLRDELAHGDVVLGTVGPVLGHLLASNDHSLFSDELVSRVRAMVGDIARQLLVAQGQAADEPDPRGFADRGRDALAARLLASLPLVGYCHSLALEGQLTARLDQRNGLDPVLSPLLQALIASDDSATASTAMGALAAQARFVQQQRRMELPLGELTADLFDEVLGRWTGDDESESVVEAQSALRASFDKSTGRLGMLARLVTGMGPGAVAALSLSHGGVALFLSALAALSHQARDLAVLATNDRQLARLSLSLRAAGLKPKQIEEQFALIHPDISLPEGFDALRADRASAMLAASDRVAGY